MARVVEALQDYPAIFFESECRDSTMKNIELLPVRNRRLEDLTNKGTNKIPMAHHDEIARLGSTCEEARDHFFHFLLSHTALF